MKCPKSIIFNSHVHEKNSPPCGVYHQEAITIHYCSKSLSALKQLRNVGQGFIAFLSCKAINEEMYSSSDVNHHQNKIHDMMSIVNIRVIRASTIVCWLGRMKMGWWKTGLSRKAKPAAFFFYLLNWTVAVESWIRKIWQVNHVAFYFSLKIDTLNKLPQMITD